LNRRDPSRTRQQKLLSFIDAKKPGIEIGPSHAPVCPKSAGYHVEIIDRSSQQELRLNYAGHAVDLDAIEPVDHVWRGESYAALTNKPHGYGWVMASHVIEHVPDLVGFLQDCDDILDDDGVLALAVPDKRYCFDRLRPPSSLAAVIDAHEAKRTAHTAGTAAEYFLNVSELSPAGPTFRHTRDEAVLAMRTAREAGFLDLHAWCFTPSSFRLIVSDLYELGMIKSREAAFYPTEGHEFFIALARRGTGAMLPRMVLALRSQEEDAAALRIKKQTGPAAPRWYRSIMSRFRPMR
jgi:2-polyprenyl-3-methyl-5-hydroxy-6-metoxy-1,4-benzoquinol methylase